jgi:hypothetical protein
VVGKSVRRDIYIQYTMGASQQSRQISSDHRHLIRHLRIYKNPHTNDPFFSLLLILVPPIANRQRDRINARRR